MFPKEGIAIEMIKKKFGKVIKEKVLSQAWNPHECSMLYILNLFYSKDFMKMKMVIIILWLFIVLS